MSELYWLTDAQMERLRPFFPPRIFTPAVIVPRRNHVLKPLSRQDYFSSLLVVPRLRSGRSQPK